MGGRCKSFGLHHWRADIRHLGCYAADILLSTGGAGRSRRSSSLGWIFMNLEKLTDDGVLRY